MLSKAWELVRYLLARTVYAFFFASERNKVIRSQSHRVTKSDFLIQCAYRVRHEFVDVALSHQHLAYCLLPRLAA